MPFLSSSDVAYELYLGAEGVEHDADNPENRFRLEWIDAIAGALAAVADEPTKPLIVTATGKYFTNGLDQEYIAANFDVLPAYLDKVHALYSALLTLPVPTIAAINGHAFGGGAMFALCADHRIMRTERGFWSLPEAALSMPFTRGMAALVRTRLDDAAATEAILTSRRYGAEDAVARGIVDEAVAVDDLMDRARAVAAERAPLSGPNLGVIKKGLRLPLLADLAVATPASLL